MILMGAPARNLSLLAHFGDSKHANALATLYWALFQGEPFGEGVEPDIGVGNYGRASTTNISSMWDTAGGTYVQLELDEAIVWPAADDLWSITDELTHWGIYDSPTGGALWYAGVLASPIKVELVGDQPRILPGGLILRQEG